MLVPFLASRLGFRSEVQSWFHERKQNSSSIYNLILLTRWKGQLRVSKQQMENVTFANNYKRKWIEGYS
jgi:hypothetical protein